MIWSKSLNLIRYTKVWVRPIFVTAVLIMLFIFQTSCQTESKKSVLILAFDQLDNEQLNCSEEKNDESSGVAIICKEFMRFTHAYTTSLQPAAAIASILTGQYPLMHQLHRSYDTLSTSSTTIQEAAYKLGFRTAYFGGNPHVLKKTGLSKYFDIFDDSSAAQYSKQIIKDFSLTSQSFLDWFDEDSSIPFFSIITNSEINALSEHDTTTTNFEKLDEKLFTFISKLKEKNIWNNSYVYIVGLRGGNNYNRLNETSFSNLHSENTLVSLLIKPPRMKGDEGVSWKNDIPVSLADLGYTLKQYFKLEQPSELKDFPLINLNPLINNTAIPGEYSSRNLLVEAANTWLKAPLQINFAVLSPTHLIIDQKNKTEIFSLVTDKFEVVDLHGDKSLVALDAKINSVRMQSDEGFTPQAVEDKLLAKNFLQTAQPNLMLANTKQIDVSHPLFLYWLNEQIKNKNVETLDLSMLNSPFKDCLKLIEIPPQVVSQLKICKDSLFVDYIKYRNSKQLHLNYEKEKLTYELNRKKYFEEIKINIWNLALENIWGIKNVDKKWYHPLIFFDPSFTF